jgi:hypothetical protein
MDAQDIIDSTEPEVEINFKQMFYPTLWRQEQADRDLTFCLKQLA